MSLYKKIIIKFVPFLVFGILLFPNISHGVTLLTDDFTGTTIDLSKWTLVGGTSGVDYIQNGNMNVRNSGGTGVPGATTSLQSASSFAKGDNLTISANVTSSSGFSYIGYGNYAGDVYYYIIIHSSLGYDAYIRNGGAYSNNTACGTYTAGAKVSMKVTSDSFQILKNDVVQCTVTVDGSAPVLTTHPVFLKGSGTGSFFDDVLIANDAAAPAETEPDAIVNLAASQWGNTTTNLTWTAPDNGGAAITDYLVDYRVSGDLPWISFNDGVSFAPSATVTGLTNGVTYEFRVRAVNSVGTAPDSNVASVTVLAPIAPSTPAAPTASAIFGINGGRASVSFSAPSANGSAITSYTVTSTPGGITATGATSPIIVNGLTNNTAYTFTVSATNGVGTSSNSPASNSITPVAFPSGKINWTEQTNAGARNWDDIASSADGTKLVATVNNGYIYTSTDSGANWTEQTNSGSRNWFAVASSSDGTKLAAVVFGGYIYTSTNSGANWTERTTSGSRQWSDITSSSDGVYLFATTRTGVNYYSTDSGANWSSATSTSKTWVATTSSSDGSKVYIASEDGATSFVDYSTNYGNFFTTSGSSGSRTWSALASSTNGDKLVASVNSGYIYTSTNSGTGWTERTSPGSRLWSAVDNSSNGDLIIASATSGPVLLSLDGGANWTTETSNTSWSSVAMSADGLKVVALNQNGYIYTGLVDLTPPTITNISSNKANGSYTVGEVIDIDVTFSEAVTSTGNVTVTLETGATDRTCTFTVTNSTTGTCNYTVVAGDASSDLTVQSISGTINDQYLNEMTDFVPATNLATNKALVIDTTTSSPTLFAPSSSISHVNSSPLSISFLLPETPSSGSIQLVFTPSIGSPISIQLQDVAAAVTTTFDLPLTGGISGVLEVTSTSNEVIPAGTYSVVLSYQDFLGNAAVSANATSVVITEADVTAPVITNVSSDKANGTYTVGEVIDIDVTFSEAVTSTGNVTVTLETGTTDRTCTFTVTTSTTGTCDYTVVAGDETSDLTVKTIAGTINDQYLNLITNFVPVTNLAANKAIVISTVNPTVNTTPAGSVSVAFLQELSDRLRRESNLVDTGCSIGNIFSTTTGKRCTATTNNTINPNPSNCPVLPSTPRLLRLNMNDSAVKVLQQILNCKGYTISDSGAGSPGKETTFFGGKTRDAVLKLQKENNLIVDGIVGNGVRNFVNK